jgi:hypothetical protein
MSIDVSQTDHSLLRKSSCSIVALVRLIIYMVKTKVRAKHKLLFNKLVSGLSLLIECATVGETTLVYPSLKILSKVKHSSLF